MTNKKLQNRIIFESNIIIVIIIIIWYPISPNHLEEN